MNVIAKISCFLERGVITLKSRKEYLYSVTHTTSVLLRIKNWTVWYIERYCMSTYTGVTNCQKTVRFFWPTLYKQEGRLCNEQQHKNNVQIVAPLRSAVEISHLQQQASLMATVGEYHTNGNARTSITAGCKCNKYICFSQFIGYSVTTLLRGLSGLGRREILAFDS